MSRFRKALAAAAMAISTAGGGLLITAVGTVPAYAAAQAPMSGGHLVATFTFQRAASAANGSSPNVILPCAVKSPAAGVAPSYGDGGGCDSGTVTCDVIADNPIPFGSDIIFTAHTNCSEDVPRISMGQDVIHSTPIDPNNPLTDSDVVTNDHTAFTSNVAVCQPGSYAVNAAARITPPDGDILIGSLQDTSATLTFTCPGGGGGGGGGCATATPSVSGQPSARRPDIIVCP